MPFGKERQTRFRFGYAEHHKDLLEELAGAMNEGLLPTVPLEEVNFFLNREIIKVQPVSPADLFLLPAKELVSHRGLGMELLPLQKPQSPLAQRRPPLPDSCN